MVYISEAKIDDWLNFNKLSSVDVSKLLTNIPASLLPSARSLNTPEIRLGLDRSSAWRVVANALADFGRKKAVSFMKSTTQHLVLCRMEMISRGNPMSAIAAMAHCRI